MRDKLINISTNFMEIKIKNFLFLLGLKEKYISFNYLTWTLIFLIKKENSDQNTYKQAICWLVEKYNVSQRTIVQGLQKIISMCKFSEQIENQQIKPKHTKTISKIRNLKNLAEVFLLENLL